MYFYYKQFFPNEDVNELLKCDLAIDGTSGGLLIGPSHLDGGVKVLVNYGYGYYIEAEYEGFEYIFNPGATNKFKNYPKLFNNYEVDKTEFFKEYELDDDIQIINAKIQKKNSLNLKSKILLLDGRGGYSIFNKYSTKIHLRELDNANKSSSYELSNPSYDAEFKKQERQRLGKFWRLKSLWRLLK